MMVLDLIDTLNNLGEQINNFLSKYTSEPIFWIVLAIVLFLIGCWAIKYFGGK